ncbi:allantoate amidohydrolase [Granulicella aggregans]|uniref:allantoate amidohydrolase n=1 Tax=Granulicella aggregans TaxID=474949 RepID=UPI0021DFCBC5|nr:allantoate amidohydrolase [Granulicella aggregans]
MPLLATQRAEKIIARCREIAACTEVPGETTRTFLAPSMHKVHTLLRGWMEAAGMSVWIDAVGNLRGVYPGNDGPSTESVDRLIMGSHLDTVPNAGAFDGILGVVLGVALIEELRGEHLPFAIEIVGFSEEEGVRFGKPYLGSMALAGSLNGEALQRKDAQGISVETAIRDFGLDPARFPAAVVSSEAFAYLEVHIEQGPLLESEDLQLGVVSAIVGQTRMQLRFSGQANHAGTTPMHLRHDAMAAAAEWICEVERHAKAILGLAATVGKVQTRPGAGNVIAGEVLATLDVRHADDEIRRKAANALLAAATNSGEVRGVQLSVLASSHEDAVPTDFALSKLLLEAAEAAGSPARIMPSGAGHDARIVAERVPISMLFLRSPGGLSHHPDESVLPEDVEAALATSLVFVELLKANHVTQAIPQPATEAHA